MAKRKGGVVDRPHIKGLQCKRTGYGQRWVLSEVDHTGVARFITVKILDNDPLDVFYRKVNDARQELRRKFECRNFEEYLNAYIGMKSLAPNTVKAYRNALIGFSFDERKNAKMVNEMLAKGYKQSTLRNRISYIGLFFSWLIQRGERIKNPVCDVKIRGQAEHRSRVMTAEEKGSLLKYAQSKEDEYRLFILLLIATGARVSTIGELTPNAMDGEGRLHLYNVKCKKRYDYAIPIEDEEIVELWRTVGRDGKCLWHVPWGKYHRRLKSWMLAKFGKDANGETLSPHSIRHTFATDAIRNGAPLEIVSKLLDHGSVSITLNVYAKFSQEQIDDAVRRATKKGTVCGSSLDLEVSDERQMCKDNREIEVIIDDSVSKGKG